MKYASPVFAGLCLVLGACGGTSDGIDDPEMTGGGSGGATSATGGGSTANGGAGAQGGTSSNGGGNVTGGAHTGGGTSEAGGQGGTNGSGGSSVGGSSDAGGTTAMGGNGGTSSSGSAGSAGAAGMDGTAPSELDYSIWVLQLPTGSGTSPTTISSAKLLAGYSDAYFYKANDGGQMFMDPTTGIGTKGSQHCRTEMRESTVGGGQAAWDSSGTNTMTVSGAVFMGSSVTIGQVFNGSQSIPLGELQYSSSAKGLKMFYEEAKGQGGSPVDLHTPIALGERYTFAMSLTKGVLTVTVNGKQVYSKQPSSSTQANKFYFKFGNYDQGATAGSVISTTPHSEVEVYGVKVVH